MVSSPRLLAEESDTAVKGLRAELTSTEADLQAVRDDVERNKDIAHELDRAALVEERRLCEDFEKSLEELSLLKTPTPIFPIRRIMSIDSMSSATDVDSLDEHTRSPSSRPYRRSTKTRCIPTRRTISWVMKMRKRATKFSDRIMDRRLAYWKIYLMLRLIWSDPLRPRPPHAITSTSSDSRETGHSLA
jgi:hypothetical protein